MDFHGIDIPHGRIAEFCPKWKVTGLRGLFCRHEMLKHRKVVYAA